MILIYFLLALIALYFFVVFIAIRLVVPYMGFGMFKVPSELPNEIKHAITDLEVKSSNSKEYLQNAYDLITKRWHAGRMDTVWKTPLSFRTDLAQIWNQPGYAHCNTQNYLLFVLLTGSRYFSAADITSKCVFFNFFIHQYLKVKIGDETISADPAGASIRGAPLGTHIQYFG